MPSPIARKNTGFTLIELSIVLVIIGLIVGGVLVGRDLIHAAEVRAQITQIEKFHQASNTFMVKYGYLPGDIPDPDASRFGFAARGLVAGQGDGNGVLEGTPDDSGSFNTGFLAATGEIPMYWVDLSQARMIDEARFTTAAPSTVYFGTVTNSTTPNLAAFFPEAKIGRGNHISIWSEYGVNHFSLVIVTSMEFNGVVMSTSGLTVKQAYSIDRKIDDQFPMTGRVLARRPNSGGSNWAAQGTTVGGGNGSDVLGDSTTCFDNDNTTVAPWLYTIDVDNGGNMNCSLSFQFQ